MPTQTTNKIEWHHTCNQHIKQAVSSARTLIEHNLKEIFITAGHATEFATQVAQQILTITADESASLSETEQAVKELLRHEMVSAKRDRFINHIAAQPLPLSKTVSLSFIDRTATILGEIEMWVNGNRILDFGCGTGSIGQALHGKLEKEVIFTDIEKMVPDNVPYIAFNGELPLPSGSIDTSLAITVLHHTQEPCSVIRELQRISKRMVLIETMPYTIDNPKQGTSVTAFFDWFYNRMILEFNTPMPCTYKTADEWMNTFQRHGLTLIHSKDLGMNYANILLPHYLFVVER